MPLINYGKQFLDNTDISNVKKVLKSNFLTQGSEVEKFETQLKKIKGKILLCCFKWYCSITFIRFSS